MTAKSTQPIRFRFFGDEQKAQQLTGQARKFMGMLKEAMGFKGIKFLAHEYVDEVGNRFRCVSNANGLTPIDEVSIYSPASGGDDVLTGFIVRIKCKTAGSPYLAVSWLQNPHKDDDSAANRDTTYDRYKGRKFLDAYGTEGYIRDGLFGSGYYEYGDFEYDGIYNDFYSCLSDEVTTVTGEYTPIVALDNPYAAYTTLPTLNTDWVWKVISVTQWNGLSCNQYMVDYTGTYSYIFPFGYVLDNDVYSSDPDFFTKLDGYNKRLAYDACVPYFNEIMAEYARVITPKKIAELSHTGPVYSSISKMTEGIDARVRFFDSDYEINNGVINVLDIDVNTPACCAVLKNNSNYHSEFSTVSEWEQHENYPNPDEDYPFYGTGINIMMFSGVFNFSIGFPFALSLVPDALNCASVFYTTPNAYGYGWGNLLDTLDYNVLNNDYLNSTTGYPSIFKRHIEFAHNANWKMENSVTGDYELDFSIGNDYTIDFLLFGTQYQSKFEIDTTKFSGKKVTLSVGQPKPFIPGGPNPHIKIEPI